jgi:hypothetical protein
VRITPLKQLIIMAGGRKTNMRKSGLQREIAKAFKNRLEVKSILVSQSPTLISSTGTSNNITSTIAQGDDRNQRNGDTILSAGGILNFRFRAITTDQTARFLVVRDNFNQGAGIAVTDVLESPLYRSEYNALTVLQQKRFTILLDKMVDSNLNGETLKTISCKIPPSGKIYYNGAASAGTSNGRGALFLIVIGDATTGLYEYTFQVKWNDM